MVHSFPCFISAVAGAAITFSLRSTRILDSWKTIHHIVYFISDRGVAVTMRDTTDMDVAKDVQGMVLPSHASLQVRSNISQFSASELEMLSRMELPDPDPEEVKQVLQQHNIERPRSGVEEEQEATVTQASPQTGNITFTTGAMSYVSFPKPPKQYRSHSESFLGEFLGSSRPQSSMFNRASTTQKLLRPSSSNIECSTFEPLYDKMRPSSAMGSLSSRGTTRPTTSSTRLAVSILPKVGRQGDADAIVEAVLDKKHVEFIDHGLTDTLPVELFLNATHVFIHHNSIEELDGLQLLSNLQVLVVSHNRVQTLQPLGVLAKLSYLDASHNYIEHINFGWDLPESVRVLDLRYNPCCATTNESGEDLEAYKKKVLHHHPELIELDGNSLDDDDDDSDEDDEEADVISVGQKASAANTEAIKRDKVSKKPNVPLLSGVQPPAASTSLGLVSTPPKREEGGRRSPGVSKGGQRKRGPLGQVDATSTVTPPKNKRMKDTPKKTSPQPNLGADEDIHRGKRRSVVDEARAARSVTFQIPELPEEEPAQEGCRPSDYIPYPVYDTSSLKAQKAPHIDSLTAPVDKMLEQYLRRCSALTHAVKEQVDTQRPHSQGETGEYLTEELRSARQVRNKARADLDFAYKALGNQSQRTLETIWSDVEKVVQTRHSLIAERQKRMEKTGSTYSGAYLEALSLLKKEQHTKELDKYRKPLVTQENLALSKPTEGIE